MAESFESEVIDRLARIETEQKFIREELSNFKSLDERISKLENESHLTQGKMSIFGVVWGVIGAAIASIIANIIMRMV